jgi:hypothetical protein
MGRNVRERNALEIVVVLGIVAMLAGYLLAVASATMFVVVADPNCVQTSWGGPIPFAYDPNGVAGVLIDVEEVTAGKYNRTGRFCDPEGDPVTVELLAGPAGMQVTQDDQAQTWTIAGDVPIGVTAIIVRAIDAPQNADPNFVVATVLVHGTPRPNLPPVLN